MKRAVHKALLLGGLVLVSAGCVKRPLDERSAQGGVDIALRWGLNPPAAGAAHCYLYNASTGALVFEQDGVTDRLRASLPAGSYYLVAHNTDAVNVAYRGMDNYRTAEVYAVEAPAKAGGVLSEPQSVFGAGQCVEFAQLDVRSGDTLAATMSPVPLTHTAKFRFSLSNLNPIGSFTGSLTGVTPSVFLSSLRPNTQSSGALNFRAVPQEASVNVFDAQLSFFHLRSQSSNDPASNELLLALVEAASGAEHSVRLDMTAAIRTIISEHGGELPIEVPIEIKVEYVAVDRLFVAVASWGEGGSSAVEAVPLPVVGE